MKFKVGDKVKLVKMEDESEYYREYLGKTYTIKRIESSQGGNYAIFEEKTEERVIPYLKNLELIKEYTHTVYESKVEILDEVEKRYLRGVIRPFKDKVKYIEKRKSVVYEDDSYICVQIKNASSITLPYFESKTMYKNMEENKEYTLEELGL